jgi:hypothetical protein
MMFLLTTCPSVPPDLLQNSKLNGGFWILKGITSWCREFFKRRHIYEEATNNHPKPVARTS